MTVGTEPTLPDARLDAAVVLRGPTRSLLLMGSASLGGIFVGLWPLQSAAVLVAATLALAAIFLKRRLQLDLLSPLTVLVFVYVGIGIAGPLVSGPVLAGIGVSARLFLPPETESAT